VDGQVFFHVMTTELSEKGTILMYERVITFSGAVSVLKLVRNLVMIGHVVFAMGLLLVPQFMKQGQSLGNLSAMKRNMLKYGFFLWPK
jgi:hypothetical protein